MKHSNIDERNIQQIATLDGESQLACAVPARKILSKNSKRWQMKPAEK